MQTRARPALQGGPRLLLGRRAAWPPGFGTPARSLWGLCPAPPLHHPACPPARSARPPPALQAQGLGHLAEAMEGTFPPKFQRMTEELCEVGRLCLDLHDKEPAVARPCCRRGPAPWQWQPARPSGAGARPSVPHTIRFHAQVIEDFGLLGFHPLAIEDRQSVAALAALIDKSNGYVFAGLARAGARCETPLRVHVPCHVPRMRSQAARLVAPQQPSSSSFAGRGAAQRPR